MSTIKFAKLRLYKAIVEATDGSHCVVFPGLAFSQKKTWQLALDAASTFNVHNESTFKIYLVNADSAQPVI